MNKEKLLAQTTTDYVNYFEYLQCQTVKGLSFESKNYLWSKGQELYVSEKLADLPRDIKLADMACGDGVGLQFFRALDFTDVEGFELSPEKIKKAEEYGYPVYEKDLHDLSDIEDKHYDVIYSSHTLEHLLDPIGVLREFKRILKNDGKVFIVLPYGRETAQQKGHFVHCGVEGLGLNVLDDGQTLINKLKKIDYEIVDKRLEKYREPEIWLELKKPNMIGDLSNEIV